VFFLLAFGLLAMGLAVRFAIAPSRRMLKTTLALSAATALTSINGIFAALSAVGHQVPDYVARHPETTLAQATLLGVGESMSPGILGFTVLSLIALILALGIYRQDPG